MLAAAILIHKSPFYEESRASRLPPPTRHRSLPTGILSQLQLLHPCVASGCWSPAKCSRGHAAGPTNKQKAGYEALPLTPPCLTARLGTRTSLSGPGLVFQLIMEFNWTPPGALRHCPRHNVTVKGEALASYSLALSSCVTSGR